MACNITSGIARGCRDAVAGIYQVYIAPVSNFDDITLTDDGAGTITGSTGLSGYTFTMNKNSSNASETISSSLENGTVGFEQNINLVFSKMEASKRNQIYLLAQNDCVIITKTRDGKYFLYGEKDGMILSEGTISSGVALTDLNGYNITFKGFEREPAKEVSASLISSIVVD